MNVFLNKIIHVQSSRMKRKRKLSTAQDEDEEDNDMPSRPVAGGRVSGRGGGGGRGIHRLNPHKNEFEFDYGSEYKAKVSVTL